MNIEDITSVVKQLNYNPKSEIMWIAQQQAFSVATYLKIESLVETRKEYLCRYNIDRRRTNEAPNK